MIRPVLAAAALSLAVLPMTAPVAAAQPDVSVSGAWSRASVGTSRPGVVYFTLTNEGAGPVTITGIETGMAGKPMVHRSVEDAEGTMTMEPAGAVTVAAGESVSFEPGGLHGMLMKLSEPLEEGDSYPLRIQFEAADPVEITVPVRPMTATGPEG